jgi:HlyD family secretion protein
VKTNTISEALMNKVNKSKAFKAILIAALAGGLVVSLSGCTVGSEVLVPEHQTATVGRGDITVDITAAGNLSYALEEDLAFETAGYVEEVLVEEGDEVSQGQMLATLDTSDLEDAVTEAEKAVENAKVAVLQTQASQLQAEASLEQEEEDLKNLKRQNIHGYRRTIAELNLEAAELNLEAAELRLEMANSDLVSAEEDLAEAQEELDGAVIIAPFDGFVTSVDVEGGDEVYKGTVAVQVVDPQRFKAEILVGEIDVFNVKLGQGALVQIDAIPTLSLTAKVSYISSTATIQSGVVNYEVELEVETLEEFRQNILETMQERQEAMQEKQGEIQGEMQNPMLTTLEGLQLKEGLNVTVSIIVDEARNVLLVPNQAITRQGMGAYVLVLKDGDNEEQIIEERPIQIGINNWQYTEVTDGVVEGEEVIVPKASATTSATSEQGTGGGPPRGGIRMIPPH